MTVRFSCARAFALVFVLSFVAADGALAAIESAVDGLIYAGLEVESEAEGCVAQGPGGYFIGTGPPLAFPAPGRMRSIGFVSESGQIRTVVSDLNAVGDCFYDAEQDVLYFVDNGLERAGAITGDTVFAVPGASTATGLSPLGLEVVPAGSIPFAAAVVFDSETGALYVSDAEGAGAGLVRKIVGGVATVLIANLDFVGGLVLDSNGDLIVAEAIGDFSTVIELYSADTGSSLGAIAGPSFAFGSIDIALSLDGALLTTGAGATIASVVEGTGTPLVSGFEGNFGPAFGGPVDVNGRTGRISFLGSTFEGQAVDRTIHTLTPVSELDPGTGRSSTNCVAEFYGVRRKPRAEGRPARNALCRDGEACDADGMANGECRFALGVCLNVSDPRVENCSATELRAYRLTDLEGDGAAFEDITGQVSAAVPFSEARCFFGNGHTVALRNVDGDLRRGRSSVFGVAIRTGKAPRRDRDRLRMVCLPAR